MSKVLPQTDKQTGDKTKQPPAPRSRSRQLVRGLGLLLVVLSGLSAWYLIVAYFGWQSGQTLLVETREAALAEQLAKQVDLARDDIDQGKYTLALRRLEWILERTPNYPGAQALQVEAQTALNEYLTPQPLVATIAAPTPIPVPTVTPGPIESPQSELQRIHRLLDSKAWEEAVSALVIFQGQFPSYERQETDALLYDAYIELGSELINGDQAELGLFYLSQAEKLGDLPQSVEDYRIWAELYLQGIAFYNVNWAAAADYFRDLCLIAPFYQSSCDRLYEVLVAHGDQYAAAQDWCPAQSLYEEANLHGNNQALSPKLNQAREGCLSATPTFTAPITGTIPITGTQP